MDINTTNIPIIGVRESEVIHRVERENETRDFGGKEQQSKQEKQKERNPADALDDAVDVSEEYLATAHNGETDISLDANQGELETVEKRLDIQA